MSEARTDTTDIRTAEAAAGAGNGRHRGPAADDAGASPHEIGHGRHRRPTPAQEPATAQ
ncbi:hypothetical protein GCM10027168_36200 [Streptomyces capparidis]|jgi:hypothetical protein